MKRTAVGLMFLVLAASAGSALAQGEQSADELLKQVRQEIQAGDIDKAIATADRAVALEPKNTQCYTVRGAVREIAGRGEEALADYSQVAKLKPDDAPTYQRRGVLNFKLGRMAESVADFDRFIELRPNERPYHWQRGISLYYAGKFDEGAKQFEEHRTVNSDDVENAAWHFLCVAKAKDAEQAKAALLPVGEDRRVPMMTIYEMFAGRATPDDVLNRAREGDPQPAQLNDRLFYAHLYIGLYYEALGKAEQSKEHIERAAKDFVSDHYMGDVARVHAKLRSAKAPAEGSDSKAVKPADPKDGATR